MKKIIIREFEPADQKEARLVILAGLGEHFGFIYERLNPDLNDIQNYYVRNGSFFLVAEIKNKVIGTAGLIFETSKQSRIVRMSVLKKYRRKGVATTLLNRLIEISNNHGISQIHVSTEHPWHDAIGFYRKAGFIPFDHDDIDIYMRLDLAVKSANK